jgi:hypothetical protein
VERALSIIAWRADGKDFPAETGIVEGGVKWVVEYSASREAVVG